MKLNGTDNVTQIFERFHEWRRHEAPEITRKLIVHADNGDPEGKIGREFLDDCRNEERSAPAGFAGPATLRLLSVRSCEANYGWPVIFHCRRTLSVIGAILDRIEKATLAAVFRE
jgi:hypothetical protein